MLRFFVAAIAVFLIGCASLTRQSTPTDAYSIVAMSWQGANIQQMLSAWPNPNIRCGPNEAGQPGCARWKHASGSFSGQTGVSADKHNCDVLAHYDATGLITRIEVRESRNCEVRYADTFPSMARPTEEAGPN